MTAGTRPPGSRLVAKFGGTSVATASRWARIERIVRDHLRAGRAPVVVCSALSGVTAKLHDLIAAIEGGTDRADKLQAILAQHSGLARDLGVDLDDAIGRIWTELEGLVRALPAGRPISPRHVAAIMSSGELMSTRLGTAYLESCALPARWLDARTVLHTRPGHEERPERDRYLSATCTHGPDPALQARLARSPLLVTQGFIARARNGHTVLLGRGGSDTSAAYFASILEAERLEIWTDVPGLFSANPRRWPHARQLRHASYAEAEVLANLGAKVLHPRSLAPLKSQRIPAWIRWTERPDLAGTRVGPTTETEPAIHAVTSRDNLVMVSVERQATWQPVGFMAEVAGEFERQGVSMDLVASSPSRICATVDLAAFPDAHPRIEAIAAALRHRSTLVQVRHPLASVSLVGRGLSSALPQVAFAHELLGGHEVDMAVVAPDGSHLTWVLRPDAAKRLTERMHDVLSKRLAPAPTFTELRRSPPPRSRQPSRPHLRLA